MSSISGSRAVRPTGAEQEVETAPTDPQATGPARRAARRAARGARPRRRWRLWLGGLALAVVAVVGLEAIPGVFGHDQTALAADLLASDAGTALSTVDPFAHDSSTRPCARLASTFGVGNHLLKNRRFGLFYASIWPSYQALNAFYVGALRGGHPACRAAFDRALQAIDENYWQPAGGRLPGAYDQGPAAFHITSDLPRVDDSLWMGMAVVQQYAATRDPALLERAEAVFTLAVGNWANGTGGIYWEATGTDDHARAVVSNAPAAILGVELYRQTSDARYLAWSERILDWLEANLRDPATGLYNDNVDDHTGQRRIGAAKYTYTEGLMVGVLTVLHAVDPALYPLSDAVALAERGVAYFDTHHSYGRPGFDVVWAESLLRTAGLYGDPAFTAAARRAVTKAIEAEPRGAGDLLTSSSEVALRQLVELPPAEYDRLLYVVPGAG